MGGFQDRDSRAARPSSAPGRATGGGVTTDAVGKRTLTEQLPVGPAGSPPSPGVSSTLQPGAMPYRVASGGMSALVQRDWLRDRTFAHYLELLRAMQQAGAAPWASPQRLERLAGSYGAPRPSAPETITFALGLWAMAQLGLPQDVPRRVERIENDLVTILTVTGMSTAPTVVGTSEDHTPVIRQTSFPRRVFSANADHSMKLEPEDSARNVSTHLRQLGHEFNEAFEQVNSAQ